MAEIAIGANCSACGTLVACAGSYSDQRLTGVCPVCKIAVSTLNREYAETAPQEVVESAESVDEAPSMVRDSQDAVPFEPEDAVDNPLVDDGVEYAGPAE